MVITDLDSVNSDGKSCFPKRKDRQKTSNDALKSWRPKKEVLDDLIDLSKEDRAINDHDAPHFVAYQKPTTIAKKEVLSKAFEDALILANFDNQYF